MRSVHRHFDHMGTECKGYGHYVPSRQSDGTPEESAVTVNIGTNDTGKWTCVVPKDKFRLLGNRLKARTSKRMFSESLLI